MPFRKPEFAARLIDWYRAEHRPMPWRETRDPYRIWLSEIMLQQTQVKTVLDYYRRFLEKFPTVKQLAEADASDVLKAWEGLGYYARARNLQAAAQKVMRDHGGKFPQTLTEMEALPGIGRSTAGAILTFAFGQRHPLLDGNVKRVLSRLYDIAEDAAKPAVIKTMWQQSESLLEDAGDPHDYNQAIMELGATVCLPANPRCLFCPVQPHCEAFAHGSQAERPVKTPKKASPHYTIVVGVIHKDGKIFIQQRPDAGLLGGLWEFPGGKVEEGETLEAALLRELQEEVGLSVTLGEKIAVVKHAYTHFKITLHAWHCTYEEGKPEPTAAQDWKWVAPDMLSTFAFPKANKTVLEALAQEAVVTHS